MGITDRQQQVSANENRGLVVVLVALYRHQNFPIRIIQPLLERIDGVAPYTIFFKHVDANTFDPPSEIEEELFAKTIADLNPDLVGFSVMSPHTLIAKGLNKIVRDNSGAQIIWGGFIRQLIPKSASRKLTSFVSEKEKELLLTLRKE